MMRQCFFHVFEGPFWPELAQLERYFVAAPGEDRPYLGGNGSWSLDAKGLNGTEHLTPMTGRVDVRLSMQRHPDHGVMFSYSKWDGRTKQKDAMSSLGDRSRLQEWAVCHQDRIPVGLFVSFPAAWEAVTEFVVNDGARPTCIQWVDDGDLSSIAR